MLKNSSQEELETFCIKWSHKLKRTEPKKFKGPEPGAIKHLSETASPLNHFFEIFPENMFSLMAKPSNSYVPIYEQARRRKSKDENWVDHTAREITVDDIRAYVGIRMIMAVDPKSRKETPQKLTQLVQDLIQDTSWEKEQHKETPPQTPQATAR